MATTGGDLLIPLPFISSRPRRWRDMTGQWSTEEDAEAQEPVTAKVTWQ